MRFLPLRVLSPLIAVCCLTSADAATITVTNTDGTGPGSLRQAIINAQENDTIAFADDVRGTILTGGQQLHVITGLTILGPGANLLTIDGGNMSQRVISVDAPGHTVAISGLTFTRGNSSGSSGAGGILNNANLTLTSCAVRACILYGGYGGFPGQGGGIYNASGGSLEMTGCTLNDNHAFGGDGFHGGSGGDGNGGGLFNAQGATATLRNCTITGNSVAGGSGACLPTFGCGANGTGRGAGIENQGVLVIESCTIASNSASTSCGGVRTTAGSVRITNTIIAQNQASSAFDASGSFTSDGFNLIGTRDGSSGFTAPGDQTGSIGASLDPMLDVLRDNGGPTETMALLPGSPAIDKGNGATVTTDQRNFRRRDDYPSIQNAAGGDASDIGAFEVRHSGLLNISTRARVLPGDNALIAGFIITHGQPKEVIVRGIGPSLGLEGKLADPTIEVHDENGIAISSNDNWQDADTASYIMSTLPPADPLESALWGIINPAAYSVILRGQNDTSGIGVVETYDLDPSADSGLGNISTRGFVGTNDEVMICGIIVGPSEFSNSTRVVLRAIGPSLTQFGISNALANPMIDVRDSNGTQLASNDDWQSDPAAATITALGLAPSNPHESATIITVTGGANTAIVSGVGQGTGVGLVEAYDVGPE
jgi:hypothetical protein